MLKTLIKKQLLEINRTFFYNAKRGRARSRISSAVLIVLYALFLVGVIGGMFGALAYNMCEPTVSAGMAWLYFTVFGLVSLAIGVFGSVFNTYAGLYQAKDNDLLLSMPIPLGAIIAARLAGVYLTGLMFSGMILLPAIIVYFITVPPTVPAIVGSLALILLVSAVVLALSCLLGWVVARISRLLKNRSIITVIVSLVFFGVYYFVYFKAGDAVQRLIENVSAVGEGIKGSAYPLYLLGRMGEGDLASVAIMCAGGAVLLALTYILLRRSFLSLATTAGATAPRRRYSGRRAREHSIPSALLHRELARFTGSPAYMLNCGLGTIFLVAAGVFLLIKGGVISVVVAEIGFTESLPVIIGAGAALIAAMNDITAPSVSLEGRSIWIAQSLPVTSWQVLRAKLSLHLAVTVPPTVFFTVCASTATGAGWLSGILATVLALLFVLLSAEFGLFINLLRPNLTWTSEIMPIKQGLGVFMTLFGGIAYAGVIIAVYFFAGYRIGAIWYTVSASVLSGILSIVLFSWIRRRGAKIFTAL